MPPINADSLGLLANFYGTIGHSLSPAWAWASSFLILIVIVLFLLGFSRIVGYGPFVGLIASLYIAYALYVAFPYQSFLPSAPAFTALGARVALYLGFFVVGYLILRRVAASDFITIGSLGLIILSFVTAGFLMALAYQEFPVREIYHFSPKLDLLFANKQWFFAWFVAPLLGLFVFSH